MAPASSPPEIIPAATVIIFRQPAPGGPPELLMVERAQTMRFAGGAAVFPGGRIDLSDRELAHHHALPAHDDADDAPARIAAIRETLEETGLALGIDRAVSATEAEEARRLLLAEGALAPVLAHMGWTLHPERLVPFARWCPMHPRSFDTRFYLADLGRGAVELSADLTENSRLFWTTAADALASADRGEITIIYPTRRNLERLALYGNFAEACAQASAVPVRMITPRPVEIDGERWLTIPEGLGYPVTRQMMATVKRG
ncbi:MAG: NUDIX hydrolase [Sphingomonadales bacterium]|nr:NUDIX hydrolase [Sphingomonadales bacterium]